MPRRPQHGTPRHVYKILIKPTDGEKLSKAPQDVAPSRYALKYTTQENYWRVAAFFTTRVNTQDKIINLIKRIFSVEKKEIHSLQNCNKNSECQHAWRIPGSNCLGKLNVPDYCKS